MHRTAFAGSFVWRKKSSRSFSGSAELSLERTIIFRKTISNDWCYDVHANEAATAIPALLSSTILQLPLSQLLSSTILQMLSAISIADAPAITKQDDLSRGNSQIRTKLTVHSTFDDNAKDPSDNEQPLQVPLYGGGRAEGHSPAVQNFH